MQHWRFPLPNKQQRISVPKSCLKLQNCWVFLGMNVQAGGEEQSLLCHSEHFALFQHEIHTHFCGLLIKKKCCELSQSPRSDNKEGSRTEWTLSLRIFLSRTAGRFPSAAGGWLAQTADGAVRVELHPRPCRITLCAAPGTAEDKSLLYLGSGQGDELLQLEDRHFLPLHPMIYGSHVKHPPRWTNLQHKSLSPMLLMFDKVKLTTSGSPRPPSSGHPGTDPAPHKAKEFLKHSIPQAEKHHKKYMNPWALKTNI